jgi:hypothetical protein
VGFCLSRELVGTARIVRRLGQAGRPSHLLAFLAGSVSVLGGLLDRLTPVVGVV